MAQDGEGAAVKAEPSEAAQRLAWLPATAAAVSLRLAAFDAAVTYVPGLPPARDTLQVGLTAQYMLHRKPALAFTTSADATVSLPVLPAPPVIHDTARMSALTYEWAASLSNGGGHCVFARPPGKSSTKLMYSVWLCWACVPDCGTARCRASPVVWHVAQLCEMVLVTSIGHSDLRGYVATCRHTNTSSGRQPPCRQIRRERVLVRMAHASSLGSPLAWGAGPGRPPSLPSHRHAMHSPFYVMGIEDHRCC